MEEITKAGFVSLMEATKASNAVPQEHSWDLYTAHPAFISVMEQVGDKTLQIMTRILQSQGMSRNIQRRDMDEKFELLVDANDTILERVGGYLDEMAGIKRNPTTVLVESTLNAPQLIQSPGTGSWNKKDSITAGRQVRLLTAKNIERPQVSFKDKVDNSNDKPFQPRITDKPNSLKPLAIFMEYDEDGNAEGFTHPYDFELEHLNIPNEHLEAVKATKPKDVAQTPLVHIATDAELNSLLRDLMAVKEFAVDLEHHSYRTFQGITCLMQISTRKCDYIIDTFLLRDKLWILNEVFTKPSIVKVFHGADSDIEWLQRDLSLYVVNMFDTHQAAKQLSHARLSLAYLLKLYCNRDVNKHFQLADWRIRPLPEELLMYAREDTHYLLYIYDVMKKELIDQGHGNTNILKSVFQRSTDICKRRYIKPRYLPDSHMEMHRKSKRMFDNRQLYALGELYKWRDTMARQEDESTGYVLPNHMLLQIAEALPREMQGILACCNPIPPLVRQNLVLLHKIILKAREQSLIKPVLEEEIRTRGPTQHFGAIDTEGALHCPHDLSREPEFRDDLPTLLLKFDKYNPLDDHKVSIIVNNDVTNVINSNINIASKLSVFNTPNTSDDEDVSVTMSKIKQVICLSPYDRYKLVRPYMLSIEADQTNKAIEQNMGAKNHESMSRIKEHFDKVSANSSDNKREPTNPSVLANASQTVLSTLTPALPDACTTETSADPNIVQKLEEEILSLRAQLKKRKREDPDDSNLPIQNAPNNVEERGNNNANKRKRRRQSKINHNSSGVKVINETGKAPLNTPFIINQHPPNESKNNKTNKQKNRKRDGGFQSFDYSAVDFKRFKGGSEQGPKPIAVRGKFKGKGKNNKFTGKCNNKSFSYKGNKDSGTGKSK